MSHCSEIQCHFLKEFLCLFLVLGTSSLHVRGQSCASRAVAEASKIVSSVWIGSDFNVVGKLGALC